MEKELQQQLAELRQQRQGGSSAAAAAEKAAAAPGPGAASGCGGAAGTGPAAAKAGSSSKAVPALGARTASAATIASAVGVVGAAGPAGSWATTAGARAVEMGAREAQKALSSSHRPAAEPGAEPAAGSWGEAAGASGAGALGGPAAAAAPAELLELRGEVAVMEEAFPELPAAAAGQEAPARRRRPARTFDRDAPREAVPLDLGFLEMKSALEELDVRLRAISSRQAILEPVCAPPQEPVALSAEAARAIAEVRAQNRHLRECMEQAAGRGGAGLLSLDRSLFGAAAADAAA